MKYIREYNNFKMINELHVHYDDNDYSDKRFILYKKDLWVFDDDTWEDIWVEVDKAIGGNILEEDVYNSMQTLLEDYPYILSGKIVDSKIVLDGTINFRQSSISDDLRKLKKELDMPIRVDYTKDPYIMDTGNYEIDESELQRSIFYHGTSLKYLELISRTGIRPKVSNANFGDIKHDDKVFVTTNLEKAFFHANTSAMKTDSFPIILKLRIPDISKLVLDYDIAIQFYKTDSEINKKLGYTSVYKRSGSSFGSYSTKLPESDKSMDISKKLGVYGYTGRIPSTYIDDVIIDIDTLKAYPEILEDEGLSDITLGDNDSQIWSEFNDIDLWSEMSIKDTLRIADEILDDYLEQFNIEDEEE